MSVVIACRDAAATLQEQLDALAAQRTRRTWEVLVVDDGSRDGSGDLALAVRDRLPDLVVVRRDRGTNAGAARNAGVAAASGRVLLFCDADDVVAEGWVDALASAVEEHGFAAGRRDYTRLNRGRARLRNVQTDGLQVYGDPPWLLHAGAGNLGVDRTVFEWLHGFEESLDRLEDADLCFRAQLAGQPLHYAPAALLHVRHRPSLGGVFRQAVEWGAAQVVLEQRFAVHGMPASPRWRTAVAWMTVLPGLLRVRGREDLAAVAHQLGWRLGRLRALARPSVATAMLPTSQIATGIGGEVRGDVAET